jgi:hypothetical protein
MSYVIDLPALPPPGPPLSLSHWLDICCAAGAYGIKDTYVVCKYVKKTVFGVGFRHLPGAPGRYPLGLALLAYIGSSKDSYTVREEG